MTFFILDPNLTASDGHHLDWDLSIAEVAKRREEEVVIFANKTCPLSGEDHISIIPWFQHSCYERKSFDKYMGAFNDFRYFNDTLADELSALSHARFTPFDCVFVPTLTELHLLGYVSWMKTFDAAAAPLFVVHLMFPSGLAVARDAESKVVDSLQALFYGLAFQRAAEPGPTVHFFGGGRQIAKEFAELSGLSIEAHPVPFRPAKSAVVGERPKRPKVLIYAGDVKAEKGFLLVPKLADRLAQAFPDWDIALHANESTAWTPELREAFVRLGEISRERENVVCKTGRLSRTEYEALFAQADCMISTYDPVHYACKSSGVLWESISLGLPILAPEGSWMAKEAVDWNGGLLTYAPYDVDAICERFHSLADRLDELMAISRSAAKAYHEANGPEMLFNQFATLWAARWIAAKLASQPELRIVPLEDQRGAGLSWNEKLDGSVVRWTAREFDISFDWNFPSPWELSLQVVRCIGQDQILQARATSRSGEALGVTASANNGAGEIVVRGRGQKRGKSVETIRVILPWTYRPEGETRELGILLRDISVGPPRSFTVEPAVGLGFVTILTPISVKTPGGLIVDPVISGEVALDPTQDAEFTMKLKTSNGVESARLTRLFVNGAPIRLQFVGIGRRVWSVTGAISRNVIARGGYATQWDVSNESRNDPKLTVLDLSFSQGEQLFVCADFKNANPGAEIVEADASDAAGQENLVFGSIAVDDIFPGGRTYRHLIVSMRNVVEDGHAWDHIKFGFLHYRGVSWLEFRQMSDWPLFWEQWPGEDRDDFGLYMRVPVSPFLHVTNPKDSALLSMLFGNLDEIVLRAVGQDPMAPDEREVWVREADALSKLFFRSQARMTLPVLGSKEPASRSRADDAPQLLEV